MEILDKLKADSFLVFCLFLFDFVFALNVYLYFPRVQDPPAVNTGMSFSQIRVLCACQLTADEVRFGGTGVLRYSAT